MASKAKPTKNTLIQRGDGATPTELFTTIGEMVSIPGLAREVGEVDVTSMDSDDAEFISDQIVTNGDLEISGLWVGSDTEQTGIENDLEAGTVRNYRLKANDHATTPSYRIFPAFVKKFHALQADAPKGAYKLNITLRPTGAVTRFNAP